MKIINALLLLLLFIPAYAAHSQKGISETPLETIKNTPPPNVFWIFDDSASMDSEFLTDGKEGDLWIGDESREKNRRCYIFNTGDHIFPDKILGGEVKSLQKIKDNSGYEYNSLATTSDPEEKNIWQSQWYGYNRLYYSPQKMYHPWPGQSVDNDPQNVRSNPVTGTEVFNLLSEFTTVDDVRINHAHYFIYTNSVIYLVNFSIKNNQVVRNIFRAGTFSVNNRNMRITTLEQEPEYPSETGFPFAHDPAGDLSNLACWFTYHRKRIYEAKYALAKVVSKLDKIKMNIRQISSGKQSDMFQIKIRKPDNTVVDQMADLHEYIYSIQPVLGKTPLRKALYETGRMLQCSPEDVNCPWDKQGGECQKSFAVILTDGFWNGESPWPVDENSDGDSFPATWKKDLYRDSDGDYLYADNQTNTLADVAMHFYERDLSLKLENLVQGDASDPSYNQHLVTYAISFGVSGELSPGAYQLAPGSSENPDYPKWPEVIPGTKTVQDDLWHSTVNGHGSYVEAGNPDQLLDALGKQIADIESRVGTASPAILSGDTVTDGTRMFRSEYSSEDWSGDIKAFQLEKSGNSFQCGREVWSADKNLNRREWKDRTLVTFNPDRGMTVPFRFEFLNETQKMRLGKDEKSAKDLVDFIGGDRTFEKSNWNSGGFRERKSLLGDIIHSSPVFYKNKIFAGFNDGMLHVFSAATGKEILGYIPDLVMGSLKYLSDKNYGKGNGDSRHRMFVDQSPVIKKIETESGTRTLLVSGLGSGGKGFFCLDVSRLISNDMEDVNLSGYELSDLVLWEYPERDSSLFEKKEMGLSFSEPVIIPCSLPDHPWVILFGNGYMSDGDSASLFILDAFTGERVRIIETDVTGNNGLSSPFPADFDGDGKLDYVYAGDLQGNLWKFDLSSENEADWRVFHHDGVSPVPLFTARARDKNDDGLYAGESYPQPILGKPVCWNGDLPIGNLVIFGTGRLLNRDDLEDINTQTLYGVWDYGDNETEFLGESLRINLNGKRVLTLSEQPGSQGSTSGAVTLLEQSVLFFDNVSIAQGPEEKIRILSSYDPDYQVVRGSGNKREGPEVHAGWFFDLPLAGERMISPLTIHNNNLVFVSTTPVTSPCLCGGTSIIHFLDPSSGGRLEHVLMDINGDGRVDDQDQVTVSYKRPGEIMENLTAVPSGIYRQSILHAPKVVSFRSEHETLDALLFMSSDGKMESVTEKSEKTGMIYWGEY